MIRRLAAIACAAAVAAGMVVTAAPARAAIAPPVTSGPAGLDHFECYTLDAAGTTAFKRPSSFKLIDQFATRTVSIAKTPNQWCVPTLKARRDVAETPQVLFPDANLLCHKIAKSDPADPIRAVKVQNQFGDAELQVGAAVRLCLPTAVQVPGKVVAPPATVDHFVCYSVRYLTGITGKPSNKFDAKPVVSLTNRYGVTARTLGAPRELCNPATKVLPSGATTQAKNLPAHLVCFDINPLTVVKQEAVVHQFDQGRITTAESRRLCVPSFKQLLDVVPVG